MDVRVDHSSHVQLDGLFRWMFRWVVCSVGCPDGWIVSVGFSVGWVVPLCVLFEAPLDVPLGVAVDLLTDGPVLSLIHI